MKPNNKKIIIIAHNIRSCENVGSILRTADAMAIDKVYFTGLTPYPEQKNDKRLPHIIRANHNKISKSALGAEKSQLNEHHDNLSRLLKILKARDYKICGLEQDRKSEPLMSLKDKNKIAIILGNEVRGLSENELRTCDCVIEIPMLGQKESLNVAQAAGITMFYARFI